MLGWTIRTGRGLCSALRERPRQPSSSASSIPLHPMTSRVLEPTFSVPCRPNISPHTPSIRRTVTIGLRRIKTSKCSANRFYVNTKQGSARAWIISIFGIPFWDLKWALAVLPGVGSPVPAPPRAHHPRLIRAPYDLWLDSRVPGSLMRPTRGCPGRNMDSASWSISS